MPEGPCHKRYHFFLKELTKKHFDSIRSKTANNPPVLSPEALKLIWSANNGTATQSH